MDKNNTIINTQFALFFDSLLDRPDLLWTSINEKFENIFNTPIIMPVPNEPLLRDIPMVQMISNKNMNINIARSRVDLYFAGSGRQEFKDIKPHLKENLSKLIQLLNNKNIKFSRVGFVSRFFIEEDNQDEVISNALKEKPTNIQGGDIFEVFLRFVTRNTMLTFEVNNFTIIEKFTGRIAGEGEKKGILITRDFNTVPGKKYEFSTDIINSFIDEAEKNFQLDKIHNILWLEKK